MRVKMIILFLFFATGIRIAYAGGDLIWQRFYSDSINGQVTAISISSDKTVYIGTENGLFVKRKSLFKILSNQYIQDICVSEEKPGNIYIASNEGLFFSGDSGEKWERIFSCKLDESICLSVAEHDKDIFLGTSKGLFKHSKGRAGWFRMKDAGRDPVYRVVKHQDNLYFSKSAELYRINLSNENIKKIWRQGVSVSEDKEINEDDQFINTPQAIKYFDVSADGNLIVVTGEMGVYQSRDGGNNWSSLNQNNISFADVTSIAAVNMAPAGHGGNEQGYAYFVSANKGVYGFWDKSWQSLYRGLPTANVKKVFASDYQLYALTDKGVFVLSLNDLPETSGLAQRFNTEYQERDPAIAEVHRWAIDYAQVNRDKILEWRRNLKKSAWLPSLDIGFDGGRDWGASDSIFGSSSGGGSHYVGPDDKDWGKDFGWDIGLSWDLSGLIWNSDETSIDSRAKLMVELREDILDQVTRLYFERKRLKYQASDLDEMEKSLRLEELTAFLDAYTGGRFSQAIKKEDENE